MPDRDDNAKADVPATPLHAYKEGREEDVKGDTDALQSNDPDKQQQGTLEGEDEFPLPHEKA